MSNLFFFKPIGGTIVWEANKAIQWLTENDNKRCYAELGRETGVRTLDQNASLHLYLTQLANALNEGGFSFKFQLGDKLVDLDWSMELCKENIWRPIQIALVKKKSTKNLDKVHDIDVIYEHLNKFFSNKPFCFHIPWPSEQTKP